MKGAGRLWDVVVLGRRECGFTSWISLDYSVMSVDRFADTMAAILILYPKQPKMLIKMIYSFIVIIEKFSQ